MNAHKTAISRRGPSAPMKWLDAHGLLVGTLLDWGCGKGADADAFDMDRYDPYYQPDMPDGWYDTITCNYVLNVIESEEERARVLLDVWNRLAPGGCAYVTVRNDADKLNGTTSKGTWQGLIMLDLPVERRCAGYVIYRMEKI